MILKTLRRYTQLPFLIDYLQNKKLILPSPASWDDKNDSFYIGKYEEREECGPCFALCLTEAAETYHHWGIFASSVGGVCIEFKKEKLMEIVEAEKYLTGKNVDYIPIEKIHESTRNVGDYPFLKRLAFKDEKEFRLFYKNVCDLEGPFEFELPISVINRIILSPWVPRSVAISIRSTLLSIEGCKDLKVARSTLIDNREWKSAVSL